MKVSLTLVLLVSAAALISAQSGSFYVLDGACSFELGGRWTSPVTADRFINMEQAFPLGRPRHGQCG